MTERNPDQPHTAETNNVDEGVHHVYLNMLWSGDKITIITISEQTYEVTILDNGEQITGLLKRVDQGKEFEQVVELRGDCMDVMAGENGEVRPIDIQAGYMQRWHHAYFGFNDNGRNMGLVTSRIDKILLEENR